MKEGVELSVGCLGCAFLLFAGTLVAMIPIVTVIIVLRAVL